MFYSVLYCLTCLFQLITYYVFCLWYWQDVIQTLWYFSCDQRVDPYVMVLCVSRYDPDVMPCKAKRQYLLTLQVSRYSLLSLRSRVVVFVAGIRGDHTDVQRCWACYLDHASLDVARRQILSPGSRLVLPITTHQVLGSQHTP